MEIAHQPNRDARAQLFGLAAGLLVGVGGALGHRMVDHLRPRPYGAVNTPDVACVRAQLAGGRRLRVVADGTAHTPVGVCRQCGCSPADTWLSGDGPLCDRCVDTRTSASTGWPRLPEVPEPVQILGPDGRRHVLRYRIWRAPTGIGLRLVEEQVAPGEGYEFAVLGDHDADVAELVSAVFAEARTEIGRCYLEPGPMGGWQVVAEEVAGRLEFDEDTGCGGPYRVIVDGRPLSWDELGLALAAFEGWRIRILIDDRCLDLRTADH